MGQIHIYKGRANTGKTTACFEEIRDILQQDIAQGYAENPSESPSIIVLVPEPSAYKAERALAEYMPKGGFYNVHVVGFSRLAYKVFQAAGIMDTESISEIGSSLLLRSIMKQKEKDLTIFRDIAKQPHFADVMKQLIRECHAFTVTPEDLKESAEKVESTVLREKLKDIATVMRAYEDTVAERFASEDMLESLASLIPESPLTKNAYVYIDGYHWFTPQQQKVVNALLRYAKKGVLTVTIPTEEKEFQRMTAQGGLFQRTRENMDEIYKEFGNAVQTRTFTHTEELIESEHLALLEKDFFTVPTVPKQVALSIPLAEAQTRKEEAEYMARMILSEMEKDSSLRYKDFAIILRNDTIYGDDVVKTLERYEIPFFMDKSHPMLSHPLSECMQSLLQVCQSNFDHEALFRLLKTDLFPLSREAVDELENYVLEFGLHNYRWTQKEDWTYCKKYTQVDDKIHPEEFRLDRVNAARKIVLETIMPFYEFAQKEHTGEEWSRHIYQWMQNMEIPQRLQKWYDEEEAKGNRQEATGHGQMYKQMVMLLDEIFKVCQEEILSLEELGLIIAEGLGGVKYSVVPPTLDHVTITTIDRAYMLHFPIVFVPGLNEGVFPKRMGQEGMLRDEERALLKDLGVTLASGALANALQENFLLYLAMTRGTKKLFLSYVSSGLEGEAMEPSLIVKRLQQAGYIGHKTVVTADDLFAEDREYIWRPKQALRLLPRVLSFLEKGLAPSMTWWSLWQYGKEAHRPICDTVLKGMYHRNLMPIIHSDLIGSLLLRNSMIGGSVTSLEQYNRCPFSYYAKYVLNLEERREKKIAAAEYGSFYHENLRVLGEYIVKNNKKWHEVSQEELEEIIETVADETAKTILYGAVEENAYMKYIKSKLVKRIYATAQMLGEWSRHSAFKTLCLEQNFGMKAQNEVEGFESLDKKTWNPIYVPITDTVKVMLRGQIDRIDFYNQPGSAKAFALIMDYKSNEGLEVTAAEVYYGLKMQLITYLQAVKQSQHLLPAPYTHSDLEPAGLIYTYVTMPHESRNEVIDEYEWRHKGKQVYQWKSRGFFNADRHVLEAIDDNLHEPACSRLPVKFNKDGSVAKQSQNYLKSRKEFEALTEYTMKTVQETGKHIVDGKFPIEPYKYKQANACTFCNFKNVCQFDRDSMKYRYLNKIKEDEAMLAMREAVAEEEGVEPDALD